MASLLPSFTDTFGASGSGGMTIPRVGSHTMRGIEKVPADEINTSPIHEQSCETTVVSDREAGIMVDQDVLFAASIPLPDRVSDEEEAEETSSEAISVPAASSSSPRSGFQHPGKPMASRYIQS